ncbi:hypothetical protein GGR53DRAFT_155595 [Hypoxylon sp. FL1150]|nr:hypothetical protein GGR53DRAFT_155595 [Hypoxylon sp. FL1150]
MSASDPSIANRVGSCPSPSPGLPVELMDSTEMSRTACTRCKTRKQKRLPVCSNCLRAGAECDKEEVASHAVPVAYTKALEDRVAQLEILLARRDASQHDRTLPSSHNASPIGLGAATPHTDTTRLGDICALDDVVGIISRGN